MKKVVTYKKVIITVAIFILVFCTFGFVFAPNNPAQMDFLSRLEPPSDQYPFGTDAMGRCVLSRILYGGQTSLFVVLFTSFIVLIFGLPIGMLMGTMKSGAITSVVESILNAVTAMPPIAYLIVFIGAWGNSIFTMTIALTLSLVLRIIKLVKAQTSQERGKAYVLCAVSSGASELRVLIYHILPNIIKESLIFLSLSCADMIVMITSFSFIGLTMGDSTIDWGSMIEEGQSVIMKRPDLIIYPMIFAFFATFSFNSLADELTGGDAEND